MILNNINFKRLSDLKNEELIGCFNKFYPQRANFLIKNWKWIYRTTVFNIEPIVMTYEDNIIGFAGSISSNVYNQGKILKGKWFVDFIIDKNKRKLGFGRILTKKWMEDDVLNLTFCNDISTKIFKKLGWLESNIVFESRLALNPIKFIPFFKKFNIYCNFSIKKNKINSNIIIDPINLSSDKKKIIDLFETYNKKVDNFKTFLVRDIEWLNWRVLESPLLKRYLLFEYNSSFIIADIFLLNKVKRLNIIFHYFNKDYDKKILYNSLLVWSKDNKIDALWHIYINENIFTNSLIKKNNRLNFLYYKKNIEKKLDFNDLHGIDGDNDLMFYNDKNCKI